ncbi:larval cuticle protein 1-like isoform X1 [Cydia pomonella]|uniref:larval cuticle protein 1-like isoform X1 n=1 Tax=Cydia pomonella TaxID=82600 RepID=UPI002ADE8251|nr:larval cuticle protein 1-like isoform X1 [Cydia pomonella]
MKLIFAAVCVVALMAVALAAPADQPVPQIISAEFNQQPEGGYVYNYETEDGIKKNENGELRTVNDEDNKPQQVVVVHGSYSYADELGQQHSVNYVADENGFQPESADIPVQA